MSWFPSLAPLLALVLLQQASDWHLPPLVPGRDATVTIEPARRFGDLRYHRFLPALARFEADVGAAPRASLGVYGEDGALLAYTDEHAAGEPLRCEVSVTAADRIRVRVGLVDPAAATTFIVRVVETPPRDPA